MNPTPPLPSGIEPGNAAYMDEPAIAGLHDRQTDGDPLAELDIRVCLEELKKIQPPGAVADFGCGTGRTFAPLVQAGWRVVGIDLSSRMLQGANDRIGTEKNCWRIQAPLTGLDFLADGSLDAGMCLYSTLGMIRGKGNRARFLAHAHRAIRPGGFLIVHAHNLWPQRKFPGGWRWMMGNAIAAMLGRNEFGDRWADGLGVSRLFIHSYTFSSLHRELSASGWSPQKFWPVVSPGPRLGEINSPKHGSPAAVPVSASQTVAHRIRATGWIVFCQRDA